MRALHNNWAYVVVLANIVVGVWGVILWRRERPAGRVFWSALGFAWASVVFQGLLGLLMFEERQPPFSHHFYGFLFVVVMLVVLPVRSEQPRTRLIVFSLATLFIGIVAIRATYSL